MVLLDCGQFTLSALSFEIRRSTCDGIDGRSAPFPRFEIRCMNSTAVAGIEMWSDDACLLLLFFLMVRSVGLLVTIAIWRHCFGRSLRPGKPSNSSCLCVCVSMRKSHDILEAVYLPLLEDQ